MEFTLQIRVQQPSGVGRFWSYSREAIGPYRGARHIYLGPIYIGLYPGSLIDLIFRANPEYEERPKND